MHLPARIAKYAIQRLLRRGGMGTLYLGYDPDLKRPVAIKVLRSDLEQDELRKRFEREIAAAAGLRHRNIVTIFDTGFHEGEPYLVMEFIPGETLADVIRRREPLTLSRRLQIIEDICAALGHAHAAGIVHRDVKPANVMIDDDGEVKVLDFGIARTAESELTTDGAVMGTLNYMAPEQMSGGVVDHRADIFALGAVMYELLTFTRAFTGTIGDGLLGRVISADPPPLNELSPDVPGDVAAIVAKAMAKDPDRRFQNARLMRAAVAAARGRNERVRPSAPVAGPVESTILVARGSAEAGGAEVTRSATAVVSEELEHCVDDAQEAMTTGQFERASRMCQEVLAIEPANTAARELLERAAARAGTLPAATASHRHGRQRRADVIIAAVGGLVAIVLALVLIDTGGGGVAPIPDQAAPDGPLVTAPQPLPDLDPPEPDPPPGPAPQPSPPPAPVPRTPAQERTNSPAPPENPGSSPRRGTASGPEITSTPPAPGPARVRTDPVPPSSDTNPSAGNDDAPEVDEGPKIGANPNVGSPPPAPAPSPPTPAAAPTPAPVPSDRQLIAELLNRYATAMTARSLAGVAAVFQMDARVARELEANFDQVRSWRVAVAPPAITMAADGMAADVTTTIRYEDIEYVARPGQKARVTASLTLQLRKRNGQWIIVGLNARPQ